MLQEFMMNGDIVTDSESDDLDALLERSMMSDKVKNLIAKHREDVSDDKNKDVLPSFWFKDIFYVEKLARKYMES